MRNTLFTGMQGVRRVWPEMPAEVAYEADWHLAHDDLWGALMAIRNWDMQLRFAATIRLLEATA